MDTIDVKRPILIKVIMTPLFRSQLLDEANETIKRLDANMKAIESEAGKKISDIEAIDPEKAKQIKSQLEMDQNQLFKMKSELTWRIKEVENSEDGVEYPFRIFEGSVQLKVGDDLQEKMTTAEIVVKDWKVVAVRNV